MNCYEHAKTGETKDAVAVCTVCGMGLCIDHAVERESRPGWAGEMKILCRMCAERLRVK